MSRRTKRVTVEPFGTSLYVATSDKAWKMLGLSRDDCYGAVLFHKSKMYVALPESYHEDVVWHEAHHVARMLTGAHGVPSDSDEHEIDAYLQEHVVRLIRKVYKLPDPPLPGGSP